MQFLGTGTESYIGLGEETTWGTGVAPADFIPFISANFAHETGLVARHQSLGRVHSRWLTRVAPTVAGRFSTDAWYNGIELLLKYGLGDHVTTTQDVTNYEYSHKFACARYLPSYAGSADPTYSSLSVTLGAGSLDDTGYQYRYTGFLIDTLTANFTPTGSNVDVAGYFYDSSDLVAPPAVSWDNSHLPYATKLNVGVGDPSTVASAETDTTAYNFSVTVSHGLAAQFPMGLNGGSAYPYPTNPSRGQITVTGSFDILMGASTETFGTYTMRQRRDRSYLTSIRTTISGETIPSSSPSAPYLHTILVPTARITSITPDIASADPIKRTVTFEAQYPTSTQAPTGYVRELTWALRNSTSGFGSFSY